MMNRIMTIALLAIFLQVGCGKDEEVIGTADVAVIPTVASSSSLMESFDAKFEVYVKPGSTDMVISAARLHYTMDGSSPTAESAGIGLEFTSPDASGTYKVVSDALATVSSDLTIQYKAIVTLTQTEKGKSQNIVQESNQGTVSYAFQPRDSVVTPTAIPTYKIALSAGSKPLAAQECNELIATSLDANSQTVDADKDLTFTLSAAGGGYFFSNSSCSTNITTASLAKGSKTKKIYYRNSDVKEISLVATLNAVAGEPLTVILDRPYLDRINVLPFGSGNCRSVSVQLVKNSSMFVESTTAPTVVTLTQTQPSTARAFYTASDCSGSSLSNGLITAVTIPPNSASVTVYLQTNGNGGNYSYNLSWSCESRSGTGFSYEFLLM